MKKIITYVIASCCIFSIQKCNFKKDGMYNTEKIRLLLFDSSILAQVNDFESQFICDSGDSTCFILDKLIVARSLRDLQSDLEGKLKILKQVGQKNEENEFTRYYSNFSNEASISDRDLIEEKLQFLSNIYLKIVNTNKLLRTEFRDIQNLVLKRKALVNFKESWYKSNVGLTFSQNTLEGIFAGKSELGEVLKSVEELNYWPFVDTDKTSLDVYYSLSSVCISCIEEELDEIEMYSFEKEELRELFDVMKSNSSYILILTYQL